jgi:hypothetical protein
LVSPSKEYFETSFETGCLYLNDISDYLTCGAVDADDISGSEYLTTVFYEDSLVLLTECTR